MATHSFPVLNQQFIVDTKYQFIREIGQGAYGVVWWVDVDVLLFFSMLGEQMESEPLTH